MNKALLAKYAIVVGMTVAPIALLPAHGGGHEGGHEGHERSHEGREGSHEGHEGEHEGAEHRDMQEHANHHDMNHENFDRNEHNYNNHNYNENFNHEYNNYDHRYNYNNEYNVNGGYGVYGPNVVIPSVPPIGSQPGMSDDSNALYHSYQKSNPQGHL
jgi:hypothetical protein